jgi:putative membrane protein
MDWIAVALFAQHLIVGLLMTLAFLIFYAWTTPHKEFELIRAGNAAAAIGLVGAAIGFVLPLNLVFSLTADPLLAAAWGAVALFAQALAHLASRIAMPGLSKDIEAGKMSAGIVQAGVGIVTGMISAAALTP